jgi:hypothetical protein
VQAAKLFRCMGGTDAEWLAVRELVHDVTSTAEHHAPQEMTHHMVPVVRRHRALRRRAS